MLASVCHLEVVGVLGSSPVCLVALSSYELPWRLSENY